MLAKARKTPQDAIAWVNLGDTLAQVLRDAGNQKYYDFAEMAYRRALELNPQSVDAMAGMAWVTGGRHNFEQSTDWAKQALKIDANNAAAFGILGDAALERGNYDEAFESYQKMMDAKPDLSSWSRGAYLLWVTGETRKALWLMEKAVKAGAPYAENTAWCRAKLAMMLLNDGAYIPAAQALEPPLAAGSSNAHVLLTAGRIAAARNDFPTAEQYYQSVLKAGPQHDALAALGDLHAAKGETGEAEKCYAQVESLHAAHLAAGFHDHLLMAKFYADHDRNLVEALRMAEQRKLTKNVFEADVLAWVYYKNGDPARANEAMKRALSRNTMDAEMQYHAGMIAAAMGDRASAQKHLQHALNYNPQFSPLQAPIAAATLEKLINERSATSVAAGR